MLFKDFINYLLHPQYVDTKNDRTLFQKAMATFQIWSLVFLISLLGVPISLFISNLYGLSFADHAGYQYATNRTMLQVVWGAMLFFPIWEELVFRIGLRYSRFRLSLGLAFFIVYISRLLLIVSNTPHPSWIFSPDTISGVLSIITPAAVLTLIIWLILSYITDETMISFYQKRFNIIFYLPLLIFALLHTLNFERALWIFAPLITIPQLFLATGFGYIRLKQGFIWGILMHIFNNAFLFLPALILEEISPDIMHQYIRGDFIVISKLSPNDSIIFFAFSFIWSLLFLGIFLSLVNTVWGWASTRNGRKKHTLISTRLNCLLPGLGQLYNNQTEKGKLIMAVFLITTLVSIVILSLPSSYSSVESIVSFGVGILCLYLTIYMYALIDSWVVGRLLDNAVEQYISPQ